MLMADMSKIQLPKHENYPSNALIYNRLIERIERHEYFLDMLVKKV